MKKDTFFGNNTENPPTGNETNVNDSQSVKNLPFFIKKKKDLNTGTDYWRKAKEEWAKSFMEKEAYPFKMVVLETNSYWQPDSKPQTSEGLNREYESGL